MGRLGLGVCAALLGACAGTGTDGASEGPPLPTGQELCPAGCADVAVCTGATIDEILTSSAEGFGVADSSFTCAFKDGGAEAWAQVCAAECIADYEAYSELDKSRMVSFAQCVGALGGSCTRIGLFACLLKAPKALQAEYLATYVTDASAEGPVDPTPPADPSAYFDCTVAPETKGSCLGADGASCVDYEGLLLAGHEQVTCEGSGEATTGDSFSEDACGTDGALGTCIEGHYFARMRRHYFSGDSEALASACSGAGGTWEDG